MSVLPVAPGRSPGSWFQRFWDQVILPALILYGMSQRGRYSDRLVVWGRDHN
jgi:hypothetical protein